MRSTFKKEDVTLLLKDITGMVEPLPASVREKRIQSGMHYSMMLPLEYTPSDDYIRVYENALAASGQRAADAIAVCAERIFKKKGKNTVIVSLARAGTPIGVLITRYLRKKYSVECPHYSISIIRDRGIDINAIDYILKRHRPEAVQFVDGWTGKGTIYRELKKEVRRFSGVSSELAVPADPAGLTSLCGTHDDILIPSSCLNCTVCGLISRTFLRDDIIGEDDFHGAAFYGELKQSDRTYEFIDHIENLFNYDIKVHDEEPVSGTSDAAMISEKYGISDINLIKPGIGETTRVLLRRVPWKVIVNSRYIGSEELRPVMQLAEEKNVPVESQALYNYKCVGLIQQMKDV